MLRGFIICSPTEEWDTRRHFEFKSEVVCLSYHCKPEICDIFTFIQVRLGIQMKWSIKKAHSVLQNYKQAKKNWDWGRKLHKGNNQWLNKGKDLYLTLSSHEGNFIIFLKQSDICMLPGKSCLILYLTPRI